MAKLPSDATRLKSANRELRSLQETLASTRESLTNYRVRATRAETEVAEWKRRFDELLKLSLISDAAKRPSE